MWKVITLAALALTVTSSALNAQLWQSGPSLSIARADCAAAVDPAGRIYAIGGRTGAGESPTGITTNTVEVFTEATWAVMGETMNEHREQLFVVSVGGFIYAIGGRNCFSDVPCAYHASTERLDTLNPSTGWQLVTNADGIAVELNVPRGSGGTAVDLYGRIYVIGGQDQTGAVSDVVERFDPARPELGWQILPSLNEARNHTAAAVDSLGRIYAIGGSQDMVALSSVEIFDPENPGAWQVLDSSIPNVLGISQSVTAAVGADGRFYLATGPVFAGGPGGGGARFDPEHEAWGPWANDPVEFPGQNSMVRDKTGQIWLIGGTPPTTNTYILPGPCHAGLARPFLVDGDANGAINGIDLAILLGEWGTCLK